MKPNPAFNEADTETSTNFSEISILVALQYYNLAIRLGFSPNFC